MDPKTTPAVAGIRWWVWVLTAVAVYLPFASPEVFGVFLFLVAVIWYPLMRFVGKVYIARAIWKDPKA